jgi:hypothetical protein
MRTLLITKRATPSPIQIPLNMPGSSMFYREFILQSAVFSRTIFKLQSIEKREGKEKLKIPSLCKEI